MYSTFTARSPPSGQREQVVQVSPSSTSSAKPKRSQVARACEFCRVHRIKCDNNMPCSNCESRGGECIRQGPGEVRTLPHAIREIERLKMKIRELEQEIENHECSTHNSGSSSLPSPPRSTASPGAQQLDPLKEHGEGNRQWEGIQVSAVQSRPPQYYGPASSFYFIGRMNTFLNAALQMHCDYDCMQPNSASRSFASPTSPAPRKAQSIENRVNSESPTNSEYLTSTQEDYFLNLFWQSVHSIYQILDENEFKEHYRSLWVNSGTHRKSSALVDIVLALCMQYGIAFMPRSSNSSESDVDSNDATIAGRWFYRRCQLLLASELESPTISTLQCQMLSTIYLCNASFQNMAHSVLATALRTAHILGLHLEPPADLPLAQKELRKRLWWTVYAVEVKTSMKLGRPWTAQLSQVTCTLPADDHEAALQSGSSFASIGPNATWLTYTIQSIKLQLAANAIYTSFYDKCASILSTIDPPYLYDNAPALEAAAEHLSSTQHSLKTWLASLPSALQTRRRAPGVPFSTDLTPLEIELFAPAWLQRQRLLLELLYHNLSMSTYRPFINFHSPSQPPSHSPSSHPAIPPTPHTLSHATSCAHHAQAMTHIMHQIFTTTDVLSGWHEAFQWQWNATLTLLGFVMAEPLHAGAGEARASIDRAIEVFERLGRNFAQAASAGAVTRQLLVKADYLGERARGVQHGGGLGVEGVEGLVQQHQGFGSEVGMGVGMGEELQMGDEGMQQGDLAEFMGLAFNADAFGGWEPLWPMAGGSDTWSFNQD